MRNGSTVGRAPRGYQGAPRPHTTGVPVYISVAHLEDLEDAAGEGGWAGQVGSGNSQAGAGQHERSYTQVRGPSGNLGHLGPTLHEGGSLDG
jgi:hypothetical protein